jgi:putative flippase GtrA
MVALARRLLRKPTVPALRWNLDGLKTLLRSCAAGLAATGADLLTLSLLVTVAHWAPRDANVPALMVGGVANFLGNRSYAFHAQEGNAARQAIGYTAVELVALALNGILYDAVLRLVPVASEIFWLVRLLTTNAVFLLWSYPLWRLVFRVRRAEATG